MTIASIGSMPVTPQAIGAAGAGGRHFAAILQTSEQSQAATAQGSAQGGTIQRGPSQGTTAHGRAPASSQAPANRMAGPAAIHAAHHRQRPAQAGSSGSSDGDLANPTPAGTGPGAALAADMRRAVVAYTAIAG